MDERREEPASGWTGIGLYLRALARGRTARRRHALAPRTEPENPRALLGTVPFLILIAALALFAVAIAWLAWPGGERPRPKPAAAEPGTAPPGWFEDAKREMR